MVPACWICLCKMCQKWTDRVVDREGSMRQRNISGVHGPGQRKRKCVAVSSVGKDDRQIGKEGVGE